MQALIQVKSTAQGFTRHKRPAPIYFSSVFHYSIRWKFSSVSDTNVMIFVEPT
jgi:hypothetical protein